MQQTGRTKNDRFKIILIIVLFGLAIFYFLANRKDSNKSVDFFGFGETSSLAVDKYQTSFENIKKLIEYYQPAIFNRDDFLSLKSFYKLPLEIGIVGKPNLFQAPAQPAELAEEQIQTAP